MSKTEVLRLQGGVQHYDWGGHDFIPRLLGVANPDRRPFAELWIGAHPKAPSMAETADGAVFLDKLIAETPDAILGSAAAKLFDGRLPYLFKVLDIAKMLSIQAHPTRAQAKEGFARENEAGIGVRADARNYKDDNHKPEIGIALSESWLLHGFRPLEQIGDTLRTVPELRSIMPHFAERLAQAGQNARARHELLRESYGSLMTLPQDRGDVLAASLLARLKEKMQASSKHSAPKDSPDYWAVRAAEHFPLAGGHYDRGIFSVYLLNLVHLQPGQGTFQPAGVLHAYLEGVSVELMANSDNVLRGGLTSKHVDVPELLRVLTFESGAPQVLDGEAVNQAERVYRTPAEEFELSRIDIKRGHEYAGHAAQGPDSILLLEGSATLTAGGRSLELKRGSIVFAPFAVRYHLETHAEPAALFKASFPAHAGRGKL
jgi:mannose-6-phosphate isomerase